MTSLPRFRTIALCSLATALTLIGGMLLGGVGGSLLFGGLPGHMQEAVKITLASIPALAGVALGGAVWGWAIHRICKAGDAKRMAWAGALGFGPTALLLTLILTGLEIAIVQKGWGPRWPIHNIFTLLFAPAAAIISGVGAWAVGIGVNDKALALRLGLASALAGGLAFLAVNLLMQAAGWVVGAPGAAERATMLTVMFSGDIAAALTGGAVIGYMLVGHALSVTDSATSGVTLQA
jgi:hypothetical protein